MKSVTRWWVNRQIDTLFLTPEIGERLAVDGACGCLNGCWWAARMVTARSQLVGSLKAQGASRRRGDVLS